MVIYAAHIITLMAVKDSAEQCR